MDKKLTYPPCVECTAHKVLEDKLKHCKDLNKSEHTSIFEKINEVHTDIMWMNTIGKWVLGTMLGYYIIIGVYILTQDNVTHSEIRELKLEVKDGEKQHYGNENDIASMKATLKSMEEVVKKNHK